MNPLSIQGLSKNYGQVTAVKNVSFTIGPQEIFGLLGPNGAGKTSIISCIVTLEKPSQGQILVNGHDVEKDPFSSKPFIGFVPQEVINHGFFDCFEILEFQSGYYGLRNNKEYIHFLLNELGLFEHRHKKVKQLSGGMKRRLLIAKALVHQPRLLILDEPTAGVDIELREQLWRFVRRLRKEGVTILLTTHYLEEAEQLCDRVAMIHSGEIKSLDLTKNLIAKWTEKKILIQCVGKDKPMEFRLGQNETLGSLLLKENLNLKDIIDISVTEGSLEDVFRQVIYDGGTKSHAKDEV